MREIRGEEAVMNFRRMLPFLALILLVNPAAAAPKPTPQDLKAVQSCLASQEGEFSLKCIGVVTDPCIKAATGKNDEVEKTNACAARELAVWETLLPDALKSVRSGGFDDITKPVNEGQKSWLAAREKLCPAFDKIEPGFLFGAANYCRLLHTAQRVLLLRRLGEAVNPH
jgi:hypothetical protein